MVEADPLVSAVLTDVLNAVGYEVTTTDSAFGAVALACQVGPCAVLLDLELPLRPGAALLSQLKSDPRTAQVPVIVVSALAEALTDERRALAEFVIAKPLDLARLLEGLQAISAKDL